MTSATTGSPAVASSRENELATELAELPSELLARLEHHGFDADRLVALSKTLQPPARGDDANAGPPSGALRNKLKGAIVPPRDEEILELPSKGSRDEEECRALGEDALRRGQVAMCVLAGGMATRMGGVVKAMVEALPGRTFLDLRLAENRTASERYGTTIPLWLMTSDATEEPIKEALRERNAPENIATFVQGLSLRLTPEGRLFRDDDGAPSTYAPGHGDLPDALARSGLLKKFRARGGKYVVLANLDNLGATVDPIVLGVFLRQRQGASAARPDVMVEVCDKTEGDKGGGPVHAEGHFQIVEEFRLPATFDTSLITVFNTNTFVVDAAALDETRVPWTWFHVEKSAYGRTAIQFERLIQEITKAMPAAFLRVPRRGADSRFLPVKDDDELARRQHEIELVAHKRGMLPL